MPIQKEKKEALIKDFGINAQDSGSPELQIAMLTERVRSLTEHLQNHKKDYSSKQGLLKMISRRNKFLKYVERVNETGYQTLIKRLGLKG